MFQKGYKVIEIKFDSIKFVSHTIVFDIIIDDRKNEAEFLDELYK